MKIREPINLRIHSQGEDAWSMLDEAFKSRQQFSIAGRVFTVANASRRMDAGKIYEVGALLSELPVVAGLSAPSGNPLVTALRDCVSVMERELNGLAVIQPELRQAREALAAAESWPWSDEKPALWNGEGLPPVGIDCEYQSSIRDQTWHPVTICGHSTEGAYAAFYRDGTMGWADDCRFRPIGTNEKLAAEKREQDIQDLYFTVNWSEGRETWPYISKDRKADYAKAIDAGYRKQVAP